MGAGVCIVLVTVTVAAAVAALAQPRPTDLATPLLLALPTANPARLQETRARASPQWLQRFLN